MPLRRHSASAVRTDWERECAACGGLFSSFPGDTQRTHGNCSLTPAWEPYQSVLAGGVGVKNAASAHPMSTFRPCGSWDDAVVLAAWMNATAYIGDGLDYQGQGPASEGQRD